MSTTVAIAMSALFAWALFCFSGAFWEDTKLGKAFAALVAAFSLWGGLIILFGYLFLGWKP